MRNYFSMKKNDKITNLLGSQAKKHYRRSSSRHQTRHAAHAEQQAAFSHDFQQFHKITKKIPLLYRVYFSPWRLVVVVCFSAKDNNALRIAQHTLLEW